ncbi:MAG TPA: hypothetical protein VKS01_01280 [Bryobacteraceae bacterium]|nr:hypothetical protein [Bryobacteraceae bacterium]
MRILELVLVNLGGIWQGIRQDFNLFEIALIAIGIWLWKRGRLPRFPKLRWPRRPWIAALLIACGAIALRLALIPLLAVPTPLVSDEFSHLLLADTLVHGRVANPTHPFWPHFESLHIIQQPHYVSNYFPGHAAILAAARLAMGNPWAGILAECLGFLLILYWALRGWMPARWAMFGVLLAALRFAIASYWINAYHGGFLPALGGALVFGSFARLRHRATPGQSIVLGTGLAILASTRPFEGALFAIPILAAILWIHRREIRALAIALAPAALLCAITLIALGAYFERITGSPFVTAYQISQKTYGWPMGLAWTPPPRVEFRHIELQRYYEYELGEHEKVDGPIHLVEFLAFRLQEYWRFFLGPVLTIPLLFLPRIWRRRRALFLALSGAIAAIMLEGAASPHYLAPATAVILAILVEGCRHLRASRTLSIGWLPAAMALVLILRIGAQAAGLPYTQALNYQSWCCRVEGNLDKSRLAARLAQIPGDHLVFVKTKIDPNNLLQWIYNDADIDAARIVWARDLGPERNARLAQYFATRRVWIVDPNLNPAACEPYSPPVDREPVEARRSATID